MIKKNVLFLILLLIAFIVTACSGREEDRVPQFLDVQFTINPEQGEVNEPITFSAKITYGDKVVTDPDEVEFEIWRSQAEKHENIPVEHKGEGVYELEKSFTEEGTYYIYYHVTAEGMHNMRKEEFIIGQPSAPEESGGASIMDESDSIKEN